MTASLATADDPRLPTNAGSISAMPRSTASSAGASCCRSSLRCCVCVRERARRGAAPVSLSPLSPFSPHSPLSPISPRLPLPPLPLLPPLTPLPNLTPLPPLPPLLPPPPSLSAFPWGAPPRPTPSSVRSAYLGRTRTRSSTLRNSRWPGSRSACFESETPTAWASGRVTGRTARRSGPT